MTPHRQTRLTSQRPEGNVIKFFNSNANHPTFRYDTYAIYAGLSMLFFITGLVGCHPSGFTQPTTGTGYAEVTAATLSGLSSSQRTGQHNFDFQWSFSANEFEIKGPKIPEDLAIDILGQKTATSIKGTWQIKDERLTLTVEQNGKIINSEFRVFNTGVTRIQSSDAQYVF